MTEKAKNPDEPSGSESELNELVMKPCPFCGRKAELKDRTFGDSETEYYRVECERHTLDHWEEFPNVAIDIWNRRAKR
jgi:hypothetical protein